MKHLNEFTWQDYLDWAEEIAPHTEFKALQCLFDACCALGAFVPQYVNDKGEFVYGTVYLEPQIVEAAFSKLMETA